MAHPVRVVHYVNQFFGGLGGEDECLDFGPCAGVAAKAAGDGAAEVRVEVGVAPGRHALGVACEQV